MSTTILSLNNKCIQQMSKIRQLERRLKKIESGFNSIALIEPDIDEIISGGRLINAISINSIDEESADTVFEDDGSLRHKRVSGAFKEKRVLLRSENPTVSHLNIDAIFLNISDIIQTFSFDNTNNFGGTRHNLFIDTIGDFDPTTVTWNNQPSAGTTIQHLTIMNASSTRVTPVSGTVTATLTMKDLGLLNYLQSGQDVTAIKIRIEGTFDAPFSIPADAIISGTVTIDKTGLSATSSYLIDNGQGTVIVCP